MTGKQDAQKRRGHDTEKKKMKWRDFRRSPKNKIKGTVNLKADDLLLENFRVPLSPVRSRMLLMSLCNLLCIA